MTASGSSQSTYRREETFVRGRKPATTRKPSWASRGVDGARKPITVTATHQSAKSTHDQWLTVLALIVVSRIWLSTSQAEPRSGPRSELNSQNRFHSALPLRYAGALSTNHDAAA